ncbi:MULTISPECIES: hypothetical protein [unclassified Streptomyces]|uniref:hypothetical protein n=1 Tax=unclassified Streptomyces TaxID=2593676 RepID=UPI00202564BA|nr:MULTISPECIES: hypothetical protein [unclassified Streptomyces]MCX4550606.1 hypothetical protein [Streptomyces sp. NBC_01500]WSC22051.1 hypothetical protein OIE60_21485 [Streptomyces sp. NBC_01766]
MRYFLNDKGGWLTASGDTGVLALVPDGYREVNEQEYNEATGTITLALPPEPPVEEDPAQVVPAKTGRAKAR